MKFKKILFSTSMLSFLLLASNSSNANAIDKTIVSENKNCDANNNKQTRTSPTPSTNAILGNEALKNGFVKDSKTNQVIKPIDGKTFNFFAKWSPSKTASDGSSVWKNGDSSTLQMVRLPSNFSYLGDGDASPLYGLNTKAPDNEVDIQTTDKENGNRVNGITIQGLKGNINETVTVPNNDTTRTGAIYKKVGKINGRYVDLKITIGSYTPYASKESQRAISFLTEGIGISTSGLSDVGFMYEFLWSDDYKDNSIDTEMKKSGTILNFGDIDAGQSLLMHGDTFDNGNKANNLFTLPTNKTMILGRDSSKGCFKVSDTSYENNPSTSENLAFTAIFKNDGTSSAKKVIHWQKDYNGKDRDSDTFITKSDLNGLLGTETLTYNAIKTNLSYLPQPNKSVKDSDETEWSNENTLTKQIDQEEFSYKIEQYIPNESIEYKDFKIEDTLDPDLEVVGGANGIKINYEKTSDNQTYFTKKVDTVNGKQKITIQATGDGLTKGESPDINIYNKNIQIEFKTRRKASAGTPSADKVYKNQAQSFAHAPNGDALYNDTSSKTNIVTTKNIGRISDASKKIKRVGSSLESDNHLENVKLKDKVAFEVNTQIPKGTTKNTTFHLWDEFDKRLTLLGDLKTSNSQHCLKYYNTDNQQWEMLKEVEKGDIQWSSHDDDGDGNKTIDVRVTGKTLENLVKNGNKFIKYYQEASVDTTNLKSTDKIYNTASATLGDVRLDTNEVSLSPFIDEPVVKKEIYNPETKQWQSTLLSGINYGETVKYRVRYKVPTSKKFDRLHIFDDLDDRLVAKNADIHFVEGDKTTPLNDSDDRLEIKNNNNLIDWFSYPSTGDVTDDYDKYAGKTLELTADVQLKDKYDTKQTIPNQSVFIMNNASFLREETNTVNFETIPFKNSTINKKVYHDNDATTENLENVHCGDTIKYQINAKLGEGQAFKTHEVLDDLDDLIDLKKVKVFDGDTDITSKGTLTIDNDKESFSFKLNNLNSDGKPIYNGKTLRFEIEGTLKYSYEVKDGVKINNTATVVSDNIKQNSNTVSIVPNVIEPTAEKWIINKD